MKNVACPSCGKVFTENKPEFCPQCGCPSEMFVEENSEQVQNKLQQPYKDEEKINHGYQNPIYINNVPRHESNGIGTAGFVISLIALFAAWIPVLGWILWVLGLLFSLIGVFKSPRGLAVAGLIISILGFIILLLGVELLSAIIRAF